MSYNTPVPNQAGYPSMAELVNTVGMLQQQLIQVQNNPHAVADINNRIQHVQQLIGQLRNAEQQMQYNQQQPVYGQQPVYQQPGYGQQPVYQQPVYQPQQMYAQPANYPNQGPRVNLGNWGNSAPQNNNMGTDTNLASSSRYANRAPVEPAVNIQQAMYTVPAEPEVKPLVPLEGSENELLLDIGLKAAVTPMGEFFKYTVETVTTIPSIWEKEYQFIFSDNLTETLSKETGITNPKIINSGSSHLSAGLICSLSSKEQSKILVYTISNKTMFIETKTDKLITYSTGIDKAESMNDIITVIRELVLESPMNTGDVIISKITDIFNKLTVNAGIIEVGVESLLDDYEELTTVYMQSTANRKKRISFVFDILFNTIKVNKGFLLDLINDEKLKTSDAEPVIKTVTQYKEDLACIMIADHDVVDAIKHQVSDRPKTVNSESHHTLWTILEKVYNKNKLFNTTKYLMLTYIDVDGSVNEVSVYKNINNAFTIVRKG